MTAAALRPSLSCAETNLPEVLDEVVRFGYVHTSIQKESRDSKGE
jgi:hypothetical protein